MTNTGGTVTAISTTAAGITIVTVTYPDPVGPVDYPEPPEKILAELKRAQDHGHEVDVTTDEQTQAITQIKVH